MRILLFGLNSSYTHTALALHSLGKSIRRFEPKIIEHTINGRYGDFLSDIFRYRPDVLCFSCYIWNIEIIEALLKDIKKVLPDVIILCGGPEVSYDCEDFLRRNPAVDYCIAGEGEEAFEALMELFHGADTKIPSNVAYRQGEKIFPNRTVGLIEDLDELDFPYDEVYIENNKNKIFYYETSRGCPYSCSYCISSIDKTYRKKSLNKVIKELEIFHRLGVPLVKLTDRTFNADRKRALEILNRIASLNTETSFHFEIAADLLDDDFIETLKRLPAGRVQIEAGIQTTNPKTLEAICRRISFERSFGQLQKVIENGNVHVHTDLIAGLPYEDINSFERSFDDVYRIAGHHLQLGFLKLLKGTKIKDEYDRNDSKYTEKAPYEILKTPWLGYEDLLVLKDTENAVERFHNSGHFTIVLEYIFRNEIFSPFQFFSSLGAYLKENGYLSRPLSAYECYEIFASFMKECQKVEEEHKEILSVLLQIDLISCFSYHKLPAALKKELDYSLKEKRQDNPFVKTYEPNRKALEIFNTKRRKLKSLSLFKRIADEDEVRLVRIDYSEKHSVTGRYLCEFL